MAWNMRAISSSAPVTRSLPSRIASGTSIAPSSRSITVALSVAPAPSSCVMSSAGSTRRPSGPKERDTVSASSEIPAVRCSTICFMRASAAGCSSPRVSMSADTNSRKESGASVDMFQNSQALSIDRRRSHAPGADELAGQFVNESVAAHDWIRSDELGGRAWLEGDAETIDPVIHAYFQPAGQAGLRAILMECGECSGQAPHRLLELPRVLQADRRATKGPMQIAHADGKRGRPAVEMSAVGGPRQHEAGARLRREKAGPLPAEVVTPVPAAPVVIVVSAGAVESSRHATCRPGSGNIEARDGIPGNPSPAQRQVLFDQDRPAVRRGIRAEVESALAVADGRCDPC